MQSLAVFGLTHLYYLVSALSLDTELFPKVVTVLDANIASSSEIFAVRPKTNEATVFLSGTDIHKYLQSLDAESKLLHVVDFADLTSENVVGTSNVGGHSAKAAAPTKKTEARIEDAHQLAIGVKKEVDFPTWYTSVRSLNHIYPLILNSNSRFCSNRTCWTIITLAVATF